jgi:two-component system response regulator HydG
VIAATKKDIRLEVSKNLFRDALFYRAEYFVERFCTENKKHLLALSEDTIRVMLKYPWPGNVREPENAIEHAVVVCRGKRIEPADLLDHLVLAPEAELVPLKELEKVHIERVPKHTGGNLTKAARILRIQRGTLYNKIKAYKNCTTFKGREKSIPQLSIF